MITDPENGWCHFKLGDFEGVLGYQTDVPVDILTAFIEYHTKGYGMAWFDEEGTEFSLVITPYSLFIIEEKETPVLHDFSEIKIEDLEKELIENIEKNMQGWILFTTNNDSREIRWHENEIRQRLIILRKYMHLSKAT